MRKEAFSKGVALVSAASLAIAGLGTAPAFADPTRITLSPLSGTSGGAIIGSAFYLKAAVQGPDGTNIAFAIDGVDAGEVYADVLSENAIAGWTGTDASNLLGALEELTDDSDDEAWGDDAGGGDGDGVQNYVNDEGELVFGTYITDDGNVDAGVPYAVAGIAVDPADIEDKTAITVYAFADTNDDGFYDADVDGPKSSTLTITFYPEDEVTVSGTATLNLQDDEVDVTASFDNINMASIDVDDLTLLGDIEVLINGDLDLDTELGQDNGTDLEAADYDSTDKVFATTVNPDGAIDVGDRVTVKIYVGDSTTASKTIRASVADAELDTYGDITASGSYVVADDELRTGDGNVSVYLDLYGDEGAPLAGETVTFELSDDGLGDATVTAGGKTLEDGDDPIKVTAVSAANGRASITVSWKDLADGDSFLVDASIAGTDEPAPAALGLSGVSSVWNVVIGGSESSGETYVEYGEKSTVSLAVRDQFGMAPDVSARVRLELTGTDTLLSQWVYFNAAGTGTYSFTNDEDDDATIDITFDDLSGGDELDLKDSDGDWGNDYQDITVVGADQINVVEDTGVVDSVEVVSANSHDADTGVETADFIVGDALTSYTAVPNVSIDTRQAGTSDTQGDLQGIAAAVNAAANNEIEVEVTDEDNAGLPGKSVTFSAAGLVFYDVDEEVYGAGSITVLTDSDGVAFVQFWSNAAGDHTVTVTSGGKSDTLDVTVNNPDDDTAPTMAWDVVSTSAAYATPGSTYTFKGTVVDRRGNGVNDADIELDYDGPGLIVGDLPTETGADGSFKFTILLGANDTGTGTVNVVYESDGVDGAAWASGDPGTDDVAIDEDFTFTVGAAPSVGTVNVGSFNGKLVVYALNLDGKRISWKVGGNWGKAVAVGNTLNRFDRPTPKKGVTVSVQLYVDGVLKLTKSVLTR